MVRILCLAIVAAAAVLIQTPADAQQSSRLHRILETGTLRVGTTGDFKPMSFRDPASKEYIGYDIEVAKQLAKDMDVELEFVATDWKTLINGIVADKYDISSGA